MLTSTAQGRPNYFGSLIRGSGSELIITRRHGDTVDLLLVRLQREQRRQVLGFSQICLVQR